MTRRVVVTGLGVVSALGIGAAANYAALREGRSGIEQLTLVPLEGLSIKIGGEVKGFDSADYFKKQELTMLDRVSQFSLVAAREAVEMSGFAVDDASAPRSAVVFGSSMGGMQTLDENYDLIYKQGRNRIHPFTVPKLMPNAPASQLSMKFGLKGPSWAVTTACASANHAIGQAFHLIRSGAADAALTGGCESELTFGVLKAWEGLRVMSKDACRPFSRNRNGMVQGEGAAVFVLEELDSAMSRGAPILAEIVGFGMTADAGDIVQPSQDGASRAMQMALDDGRLDRTAIGYVNAHGTATTANDKTETAAIREVFGAHADDLVVSSTKSMHGHCIGAAGAIELVPTIMALKDGVIAPTINYDESDPDPECDLDVAPNTARQATVDAAISNSFAFGGLNAVVALKAWRGA